MDTGRGQAADFQLTGSGGKGEDIIVAVGHFVGDKFLVFLPDEVVPAPVDEQVAFECRLLVISGNARPETAVGRLDVAVAVVDTDNNGVCVVVHKIHRFSFLPLCGDTNQISCRLISKCQPGTLKSPKQNLEREKCKPGTFCVPPSNEKPNHETSHALPTTSKTDSLR